MLKRGSGCPGLAANGAFAGGGWRTAAVDSCGLGARFGRGGGGKERGDDGLLIGVDGGGNLCLNVPI